MGRGTLFVLVGAFLWGTISFFVKNLYEAGFTPMEVVTIRVTVAAIILCVFTGLTSNKSLKLQRISHIKYFIGTGVFSITFFNYCMFKTIQLSTVQVSAALLYTGPAFVIIISLIVLHEKITRNKILSLLCTCVGIILVVEFFPLQDKTIPIMTIIIGLCSGIGYALYSIFSKFALQHYDSLIITTYTFLVSAIVLIPFFPFSKKGALLIQPDVYLYALGLGFVPTAIAYILYTYGLSFIEASKAAILSTMEPVVATLIGIFIFTEPFTIFQIVGMGCILLAVMIIELPSLSNRKKKVIQ